MKRSACLLLAAVLAAAEPADPAQALRLSASGPGLASAASAWRGHEDALLACFADPDPARRRGAARLAAALPIEAKRLATALAASADHEVRRLGANGLRGADLPPAMISALDDAAVAAALVADHPGQDPLADPALGAAVERWLIDPATSTLAAHMIAARGTRDRWAKPLVAALAANDYRVIAAAHGALQIMTRTQRSLDAYGGDRALLAQDWRDTLAAAPPAAGRSDPELLALVAELPDPGAMAGLLARGQPALAAIDEAQKGVGRQRRHELETAARLLAHEIPAKLWTEHAAAFAGIDDPDPQVRIACLRALVPLIRERRDPDGLRHLVAWLDDRDSAVRATALDLLVRLSDEGKVFAAPWRVDATGLFPPERTLHRLRRCLRDGGGDEQIAALLLIGTLSCNALADEAMALVVSPREDVATTALETLTRVQLPATHIPTLDRLASQPSLPRPARLALIKVLGAMMERTDYSSRGQKQRPGLAAMAPLVRLIGDPDARIATAAAEALAKGEAESKVVTSALDRLIARDLRSAALRIAADRHAYAFLVRRVLRGEADADDAAFALADGFVRWKKEDGGATSGDEDKALTALLSAPPPPATAWAGHAVLAFRLHLMTPEAVLGQMTAAAPAIAARAAGLLAEAARDIPELGRIAALADRGAPPQADQARQAVVKRAIGLAGFSPGLLPEILRTDLDILGSTSHDDSHDTGDDGIARIHRVVTLADGAKLKLVADQPDGKRSWDYDRLEWKPDGPAPPGPDDQQLASLVAILEGLHPSAGKETERDLALAWMARREPPPALASAWNHADGLCRILASRSPAFASAIRARIAAEGANTSTYALRSWLPGDDGTVIGVALTLLAADSSPSEWEMRPVIEAMGALPAERLAGLLPRALSIRGFAKTAGPEFLVKAGPLPLDAALALVEQPMPSGLALAPIPADAADAIRRRLAAWTPAQVLSRADAVRRLRTAGSAAVDAALAALIATQDATAAAWLRSGIPLEAGMLEAYRSAESSAVPALALVGSAFALKEGRLAPAVFLERVGTWPPEVQTAAAAAALRHLGGRWDGLAAPAAAMLGKLGARALAAWIAQVPADPAITAALVARVADPAIADAIGGALMQRQTRDQAAWQAPVRSIAAAARGRLDWLLGSKP